MAGAAAFGRPTHRVDGVAKVTGAARYGADHPVHGAAHAFLVTSAVARGRIRSIEADAVRALPGVLLVLTHENAHDVIGVAKSVAQQGPSTFTKPPLSSPELSFGDQIVALVVAAMPETARDAAQRLHVAYDPAPATASFADPGAQVVPAHSMSDSQLSYGDVETAWRDAEVQVHAQYETPIQHHNPLELFQCTCAWEGERLVVWESSQNTRAYQHGLAAQLGIPPERISVRCPLVGGAFGSRGQLAQYTALAAHAARVLGRPVKLVATRQQGFTVRTFRAETRQDVRLGATRDGRLQALAHESWEVSAREDVFAVAGSESTARLYACTNVRTEVHNVLADRQMPGFMRAPPELPYLFALESAMDELANALRIDPIELRRRNETQVDPLEGKPYSSRSLMQGFEAAAYALGWEHRNAQPGRTRDGDTRYVNHDLAEYLVPTNADVEAVTTILVPEEDTRVNPLGMKGAGEIGATGVNAAIANAVFNATGVRVRKLPIRLDNLLSGFAKGSP
jgi:xanthine dehydrogenase YagR molybdenum-binding subunit